MNHQIYFKLLFVGAAVLGTYQSQAFLLSREASHEWIFENATCAGTKKSVQIIPGLNDDFQISLKARRNENGGLELQKKASIYSCNLPIVETHFTFNIQDPIEETSMGWAQGQIQGNELLGSRLYSENIRSCGYSKMAYFSEFLYGYLKYDRLELKRSYVYRIFQDQLTLSFWDIRCLGPLDMHFKSKNSLQAP